MCGTICCHYYKCIVHKNSKISTITLKYNNSLRVTKWNYGGVSFCSEVAAGAWEPTVDESTHK